MESYEFFLINGDYWRWEGYGSLICARGGVAIAHGPKGKPGCKTIVLSKHMSKKSVTPSNSSNDASPLEMIEKKCTELGFTKGTEKHGDCVMKLYK